MLQLLLVAQVEVLNLETITVLGSIPSRHGKLHTESKCVFQALEFNALGCRNSGNGTDGFSSQK